MVETESGSDELIEVLSMMLDEITSEEMETRTVLDDSGNNYDGTAHGSLRLVYDDTFGSCMSFEQEGDYISLPNMQVDFSQGLTIEVWAHYSSFGYESRILDFMSDSREYGIVFANDEEKGDLVLEILSGGRTSNIKSEGVLSAGRWMHLAATVDATGRAHVKISVVSFTISFGSSSSKKKKPIDWQTFKSSFLPEDNSTCSIAVSDGLVSAPLEDQSHWVINPKHFCLIANSAIPAKAAYLSSQRTAIKGAFQSTFGVGPMEVESDKLNSDFIVVITRKDETTGKYQPAEADFELTPILKNVPAALWGETMTPDLKGQTFIEQALCGFEIRPANAPAASMTRYVERSKLQYSAETINNAYEWTSGEPFRATAQNDSSRRESINKTIASAEAAQTRAALMGALGVTADVSLSDESPLSFLIAPSIEAGG